jgi:hypothetical protein
MLQTPSGGLHIPTEYTDYIDENFLRENPLPQGGRKLAESFCGALASLELQQKKNLKIDKLWICYTQNKKKPRTIDGYKLDKMCKLHGLHVAVKIRYGDENLGNWHYYATQSKQSPKTLFSESNMVENFNVDFFLEYELKIFLQQNLHDVDLKSYTVEHQYEKKVAIINIKQQSIDLSSIIFTKNNGLTTLDDKLKRNILDIIEDRSIDCCLMFIIATFFSY